jgi:FlaA1/EpsC-like NDP-sugar epimerase
MREQVKLLDMTHNLIRLAGYIPDVEIPITFIGVRPGKKPHEELVEEDERLEPSGVEKIPRVQLAYLPQLAFQTQAISELKRLAIAGKPKEVIELLCEALPTFQPIQSAGMATATNSSERSPLVPQRRG